MARYSAPGVLDTKPSTVVESFMQQEALRYRMALIKIEATRPDGIDFRDHAANVWQIATEALDAGDEAAG